MWARVIVLALLLPVLISDAYGGLRLRSFSASSVLKFTGYFFAIMTYSVNQNRTLHYVSLISDRCWRKTFWFTDTLLDFN
ncbi:hypothetical protein [Nostoc sp.]